MAKAKTLAITLLTLMMLTNAVLAQDTISSYNPTILPGNPMYGIKMAFEKLNIALTRNADKKNELLLEQLQRRNVEIQKLQEKNKTTGITRAQMEHQRIIDEIESNTQATQTSKDNTKKEIGNNLVVLQRVMDKLTSDSNPNNDKAIQSLNTTIQRIQNKRGVMTA